MFDADTAKTYTWAQMKAYRWADNRPTPHLSASFPKLRWHLNNRQRRPWLCGIAFLSGACLICGLSFAGPAEDSPLLSKALEFESKKQWRDAFAIWESVPPKERTSPVHREGYQRCLRHVLQERRHRERGFRDAILNLKKTGQVLDVYVKVVHILQTHYVDLDRTAAGKLFRQGLLEMRCALEDEVFRRRYLAAASPESIADFQRELLQWNDNAVTDAASAREQLRKVGKLAQDMLSIPLPVTAFEFVCGACNSLDEYTAYLTPSQVSEMQALLRGKFAGPGIEVAVLDQKLVVGRIHPESQAARTLKVGDRILRVDRRKVDPEAAGEIRASLRGEPGSYVEVEIQSADGSKNTVKLERQPYVMPSVEFEPEPRNDAGYIRVMSFTETTVQELKDAIGRLQAAGMKGLILDLRGNPGGLFKPSIQTAEMFLPEGIIVHTQSRSSEFNESHKSHNPNAMTFPLVLLVDGDTASSAEVVAGALKENDRARLVGQTTFGKGSIQHVVPLEIVSAGVKITVARFLSPTGQPYNGRGVTPHVIVEVNSDQGMGDQAAREAADLAVRLAAFRELQQILTMMMMR
jgi:carboxyl-terminal processing protease